MMNDKIVRIPNVGELLYFKSRSHEYMVVVTRISENGPLLGEFEGYITTEDTAEFSDGFGITHSNKQYWHSLS